MASASAMGMLIPPIVPADFAWRFQLMELLPISVVAGYACASVNTKALRILVLLLVSPVALLGYQDAASLTPTISSQGYSEISAMAALASSHSVLLVQGTGVNAYWPEYLLGLPVVSNATTWLCAGYSAYLVVGSQGLVAQGPVGPALGNQSSPAPPSQRGSQGTRQGYR